jgi:outer membrane protein TolC
MITGTVRKPDLWIPLLSLLSLLGIFGAGPARGTERPALKDLKVLDLKTAVETALAENPSIDAARARVDQAMGREGQANARRWPSLEGSASVMRQDLAEGRVAPMSSFSNPSDLYAAELRAQWVLFDGFSRRHTILAAQFARDGSKAALQDSRRQLVTAVSRAFYTAQLARENISIAGADETFNGGQLEEARTRQKAGAGSLSDALNFEVRVNAARSSVIRARRSYAVSMATLASLLAIPDASFPKGLTLAPLAAESDEEMNLPEGSQQLEVALRHRPDIGQSDKNRARAEAQAQVSKAEHWPSLALQGSLGGEREDDFGFGGDDFGTRVGGTLTYTFSDGGARRARVREAAAAAVEARRNHESLSLSVAAEVRESVAEVKRAQEQLGLQRKNTKLVERNRDLVEKEYHAGQGSLVRLNEAQRDLVNARAQLALALVSLRTAHVSLQAATGEILSVYATDGTP